MSKLKESKETRNNLLLIVKSSAFVFVAIMLSKFLSYLYRIIIAKQFGAEYYGLYTLGFSILGMVVTIASLGLTESLLKFIPEFRAKKKENSIAQALRFSSLIVLVSSLIFGIGLYLFSDYISITIFSEPKLSIVLKIFSLLVPFWIFNNYFIQTIQAYEKISKSSFLTNILPNVLRIVLITGLIYFGLGSNSIFYSFAFALIITCFVSMWYFRTEVWSKVKMFNKTDKGLSRQIFSYSWPFIFAGIITQLFAYIDSLMIGYYLGPYEVGLYNAALPIAFLFFITPDIFMQLFFPLINRLYGEGKIEQVKKLSKQIGKWVFMVNIPIFFIFLLNSKIILEYLFGAEFAQASGALNILLIGTFFASFTLFSEKIVLMKGKSKLVLFNIAVGALFNVILNSILVPKYGISGASIATSISWAVLGCLLVIESKILTNVFPMKRDIIKIGIVALVIAGATYYVSMNLEYGLLTTITVSALFLLLYVISIFIFRLVDEEDSFVLEKFKNKVSSLVR